MTVSSTTRKAGPFAGNGVTTAFSFSFKVFDKTDIKLLLIDSTGASQQLTLDSDYSVAVNVNQETAPGGTITYPISGSPLQDGNSLVALGDIPNEQQTDLTNQGGFYPQSVEDMVDRATIQIQQLAEVTSRAITISEGESTSPTLPNAGARENTVLGFDASGNVALLPLPASVGAGNLKIETWTAGVDFQAGVSTSVQTSRNYVIKDNIGALGMDGTFQDPATYQLSGTTLTFTDGNGTPVPIPAWVKRIWCFGGTTLSTNITPDGSVTDAKAATGSALYNRIFNVVDVKDLGAVGNGVADDTAAFNAAEVKAKAEGKSLRVSGGTFLINSTGLTKLSGVDWFGYGRDLSIIKAATDTWGPSLVGGGTLTNTSFYDIGFDTTGMSSAGFPAALAIGTWNGGEIANCAFNGIFRIGLAISGGTGFDIHDNVFNAASVVKDFIAQSIWVRQTSGAASRYKVRGNLSIGIAFNFDGTDATIEGNNIFGWGYGSGITTETTSSRFVIKGNMCCFSNSALDANAYAPAGIECWSPYSTVSGNLCHYNAGAGIHVGCAASTISHNVCTNNGQFNGVGATQAYRVGIIARWYSAGINSGSSNISDNICLDTGGGTQLYGYADDGPNVAGLTLANNTFFGATGPMNATGTRYDFKGPKLQQTVAGLGAITVPAGGVTGQFSTAVSGAKLGDKVNVSINQNLNGVMPYGWVSSDGNVTVNYFNPTGSAVNIAGYTANITVEKPINYANY